MMTAFEQFIRNMDGIPVSFHFDPAACQSYVTVIKFGKDEIVDVEYEEIESVTGGKQYPCAIPMNHEK